MLYGRRTIAAILEPTVDARVDDVLHPGFSGFVDESGCFGHFAFAWV
jgi:hypothetical protein